VGLVIIGGLLVVTALLVMLGLPESIPDVIPTETLASAGNVPDQASLPRVSVGDAKAAFDLKQAVFVDVRDEVSYDLNHIPGALSIPEAEIGIRLYELNTADWIITYCT
jgi:hypothetical protein